MNILNTATPPHIECETPKSTPEAPRLSIGLLSSAGTPNDISATEMQYGLSQPSLSRYFDTNEETPGGDRQILHSFLVKNVSSLKSRMFHPY